jgi:phosphatidylglycerophosphate synthase
VRVPISFLLLVTYRVDHRRLHFALALFVLSAVTDKLDGLVARWTGVASREGYIIDGFADRTLSVACILLGAVYHALPLWVALVAICRELLLYTCRLLLTAWHPPPRYLRAHSLIVYGVTRLWFLGLIIASLYADLIPAQGAIAALNTIYALVVSLSSLLLLDVLFRSLVQCLGERRS